MFERLNPELCTIHSLKVKFVVYLSNLANEQQCMGLLLYQNYLQLCCETVSVWTHVKEPTNVCNSEMPEFKWYFIISKKM